MGAGAGMPEKRADAICNFRGQDVLKLAGLLLYLFLILNAKGLHKKALG
jgi:hypothetical protein